MKFPEILSFSPPSFRLSYTERDAILYALSVGAGEARSEPADLRFVYERDLVALPTLVTAVLRIVAPFVEAGDLDFSRTVHAEQRLKIHAPVPPEADLLVSVRCREVVDKGDKGALVTLEAVIDDLQAKTPIATSVMTLFCRGDGNFGGATASSLPPHVVPSRPADLTVIAPTTADQALLFRLNGDRNPLHVDPVAAREAGFERPILHGLCTYGILCRSIIESYCSRDSTRVSEFDARFVAPVYPGETLKIRTWLDGATVSFECDIVERGIRAISNGRCVLQLPEGGSRRPAPE